MCLSVDFEGQDQAVAPVVSPKATRHHCSVKGSERGAQEPRQGESRASSCPETRLDTNQLLLPQTPAPTRGPCSNEKAFATWRTCFKQNLQQRLRHYFP